MDNLKCHFGTSSWGGKRKLPFAYTEQGVYMLATVLNKPLAVKQSIAIIRLFKSMKDYIVNNKSLLTHDEALSLALDNRKEISSINTKLTSMATKDDIEGVENRLNILSGIFVHFLELFSISPFFYYLLINVKIK